MEMLPTDTGSAPLSEEKKSPRKETVMHKRRCLQQVISSQNDNVLYLGTLELFFYFKNQTVKKIWTISA